MNSTYIDIARYEVLKNMYLIQLYICARNQNPSKFVGNVELL